MISAKKILEGCLLAVARDTSEKWKLYMDGVEIPDDASPALSQDKYANLDYNQHLFPLYKLAGYYCLDLRAGLTTASAKAKRKEMSTVMDDFPNFPRNVALFTTRLQFCQDSWWTDIRSRVAHTSLVIRDKGYKRIPSTDLVIGDIVFASSGDILGADVRVIVCSPGSVIDISSITNISHDLKGLQEKPTDLNPLKSGNVAPAHCVVMDGLFFGIVIRTGSSTIYSQSQLQHEVDDRQPQNTISYPFVLKDGDRLVQTMCSIDCYPIDVDRLLSLKQLSYIVVSLPYDCEGITECGMKRLCLNSVGSDVKVLLCREMDICYNKEMWRPASGYVNVSCKTMEEVDVVVDEFVKGKEEVGGLTVHPSQYYSICKRLQGKEHRRVLFVGGSCFEHATAMGVANVSLAFVNAKDYCKLRSHGILLKNSLVSVAELLELFSNAYSVKCSVL